MIAETSGAVAVRSDDPIASRQSIAIEELRDREIVVDFARANPTVLAATTRRLIERGIARIAPVSDPRSSEIEIAAQIHSRRLVALVASVIAGLLPAWRASVLAPAPQLKAA